MKNDINNRFQTIVRICEMGGKFTLYLLVFFLPLFFLPTTYDPLDFNKQFLLGVLAFIALVFWLIKSFFSNRFEINVSPINVPILILIVSTFFSLIFSQWRYSSFWGWPFNVGQGFLTLIYFFAIYFLITNYFEKEKEIFNLLFTLIFSGFFVSIISIFNLFGKSILPWTFAKVTYFNTIGSISSLALFLTAIFPLCIFGLAISKNWVRRFFLVAALLFLVLLFLINLRLSWVALAFSSAVLFIFGLIRFKKNKEINLVFLPMLFLIISLTFLAFSHPVSFLENTFGFSFPKFLPEVQFPMEVSITQATEFNIIKGSFKNIKNLFLGVGPSNFVFDYLKYKPIEINKTQFWDTRFQVGASDVLDRLEENGVLGVIFLSIIILIFLFQFGRFLKTSLKKIKEDKEEKAITDNPEFFDGDSLRAKDLLINIYILSSFLTVLFGLFVYPASFVSVFIFWFILAITAAFGQKRKKKITPSFPIAISFTLIFIAGVIITFSLIKNYQAEVKYLSGINYLIKGNTEEAIIDLEQAVNLNSNLDAYWRDLSQVYLSRASEISQDQKLSEEEMTSQSQDLILKAVKAAEKATEISPANSLNWTNRGSIHESLITKFLSDNSWISTSLDFYQRAADLEPSNPQIFTEIGKIYIQKSDILGQQKGDEKDIQENLDKASENLKKALELKADFVSASIQLAAVLQREEKTSDAIKILEEAEIISPFNSVLAYQIGILYYGEGNNDLAKAYFEKAIQIDQNYSNARYFLGLIYAKEGEKEKAIEQFERIEKLNPEDETIKNILQNLREGKLNF